MRKISENKTLYMNFYYNADTFAVSGGKIGFGFMYI